MEHLKSRAIEKASGKLGSYFPVSIALIVCRDTRNRSAKSPCDQDRSARSTRRRLFTDTSG
jgi:hypothetical protein